MPVDAATTPQDVTPEEGERLPARFWWPRWLGIGTAVVLAVLLLLRWGWDWYATAKLDAAVAAIKAKGEPIYPEDFDLPPVPDRDNAVLDYRAAIAALPPAKTPDSELSWQNVPYPPYTPQERKLLETLIPVGRQTLELLRQARNKAQSDWGIRYRSPTTNQLNTSQFSGILSLSRFGASATYYQHETGSDAEAVETIFDLLALARTTDNQPLFITHLVSLSVYGLAQSIAANISTDMQISPSLASGPATNPANHPASRQQVQALISALLDESELIQKGRNALLGERMFIFDSINCVLDGRVGFSKIIDINWIGSGMQDNPVFHFLYMPVMKLDTAKVISYLTHLISLNNSSNWQSIKPFLPRTDTQTYSLVLNPQFLGIINSFNKYFEIGFRALANRRMAAIALAIRLYQIDHAGQRPAKLEDLVPNYLPAVPRDPFDAANGPILYKPNMKPAVLYSVGDNGIDDGGVVPSDEQTRNEMEWKVKPDFIVPLDRVPRPPPDNDNPTTYPAEEETPTTTSAPDSEPAIYRKGR